MHMGNGPVYSPVQLNCGFCVNILAFLLSNENLVLRQDSKYRHNNGPSNIVWKTHPLKQE